MPATMTKAEQPRLHPIRHPGVIMRAVDDVRRSLRLTLLTRGLPLVLGVLVWNGYGPGSKCKANLTAPLPGLANDTWHTFGLSWGTNGYRFYYDEKVVWSETSPVSRRSQYVIRSSEVWQRFAGPVPPGGYGSQAASTTDMQVDYVRAYQNPAADALGTGARLPTPRPEVRVVENGESKAKPEDCRGIIVGPGINQPEPFPGYAGFVGWESPVRLQSGDWLVGFNAGYWHASAPTPLRYPAKSLNEYRRLGLPAGIVAPTGGRRCLRAPRTQGRLGVNRRP